MSHVVIVGAGPAGAGLALLLARRGVGVTLVERRRDFAREFRGEVLMPSGVDALQQMGLQRQLEAVPHHEMRRLDVYMNGRHLFGESVPVEESDGLKFMAVSQPALLEMLVAQAAGASDFRMLRGAAVREFVMTDGRVSGVRLRTDDGEEAVTADLVVGADGRHSAVRRLAGLTARHVSPPMDIVWCKVPCPQDWPGARAYAGRGHLLVAYHTWDDTLQLGWVIMKGTFGELRGRGIEGWVEQMARQVSPDLAAHLRAHVDAVERPFLLDAVSDCVASWSVPGVLVIGDAAHTMSPVGGQGINIALRDALVAANRLVPLLTAAAPDRHQLMAALKVIEDERMPEVRKIQAMQALPPKLMLSRAWWGEPLRRIAGALIRRPAVRQRAAGRVSAFPFGVTDVRLTV